MTDQIPEREYSDDELITCLWCQGSTPHETAVGECCWNGWKHQIDDLAARLAASQALAGEMAEALTGLMDLNNEANHERWVKAKQKSAAVLIRYQEATR